MIIDGGDEDDKEHVTSTPQKSGPLLIESFTTHLLPLPYATFFTLLSPLSFALQTRLFPQKTEQFSML